MASHLIEHGEPLHLFSCCVNCCMLKRQSRSSYHHHHHHRNACSGCLVLSSVVLHSLQLQIQRRRMSIGRVLSYGPAIVAIKI